MACRNPLCSLLVVLLVLVLAACGASPDDSPTSVADLSPVPSEAEASLTSTAAQPAAPSGDATPTPSGTPTVAQTPAVPPATLQAELAATVSAELPPTPTPEAEGMVLGGIEGVRVLSLQTLEGKQPFWAVASQGLSLGEQNHFLAVYTYEDGTWRELDRTELETADVLFDESVQQVEVAPEYVWIEVQGTVGAHSGVYYLWSFDGLRLQEQVSAFNASPVVGRLEDLNDDELPEVVLDQSDFYVFCYACNVIEVSYELMRWDGEQMVAVALEPAPESAPEALQQAMDDAIMLAQADLWQDAAILAEEAAQLNDNEDADAPNETITWNTLLIELIAEGRAEHARTTEYPLLGNMFYGDYTSVLGILSGYSAEELFSRPNPLIAGTVAEGWEAQLVEKIESYTTRALAARPDLAEAVFLRGWARYLADPTSAEALADVQRAAELEPEQPLFAESVEYLRSGPAPADDNQAVAEAARAYMQQRTGTPSDVEVTIEKLEGNYARALIAPADEQGEPLRVFLRREGGIWSVIADVTAPEIDRDAYQQLGIPESMLIDLPGISGPPR
jgi:tetratricopeptide (TPR) repeat protein